MLATDQWFLTFLLLPILVLGGTSKPLQDQHEDNHFRPVYYQNRTIYYSNTTVPRFSNSTDNLPKLKVVNSTYIWPTLKKSNSLPPVSPSRNDVLIYAGPALTSSPTLLFPTGPSETRDPEHSKLSEIDTDDEFSGTRSFINSTAYSVATSNNNALTTVDSDLGVNPHHIIDITTSSLVTDYFETNGVRCELDRRWSTYVVKSEENIVADLYTTKTEITASKVNGILSFTTTETVVEATPTPEYLSDVSAWSSKINSNDKEMCVAGWVMTFQGHGDFKNSVLQAMTSDLIQKKLKDFTPSQQPLGTRLLTRGNFVTLMDPVNKLHAAANNEHGVHKGALIFNYGGIFYTKLNYYDMHHTPFWASSFTAKGTAGGVCNSYDVDVGIIKLYKSEYESTYIYLTNSSATNDMFDRVINWDGKSPLTLYSELTEVYVLNFYTNTEFAFTWLKYDTVERTNTLVDFCNNNASEIANTFKVIPESTLISCLLTSAGSDPGAFGDTDGLTGYEITITKGVLNDYSGLCRHSHCYLKNGKDVSEYISYDIPKWLNVLFEILDGVALLLSFAVAIVTEDPELGIESIKRTVELIEDVIKNN